LPALSSLLAVFQNFSHPIDVFALNLNCNALLGILVILSIWVKSGYFATTE
jgi:hypothetical protein